jgi:hypothetical protein
MSSPSDVRVIPRSPAGDPTWNFILRVCTKNPFYALSAALFLFGLRVSCGEPVAYAEPPYILAGLAAYTLLLAGTAALLVRFGNVWDDVRTVLLLTVFLFLATSLTFDQWLFQRPLEGVAFNVGGLALAVVVSEGILHSIRLRLPALLRVPYYLALALFFLYPLLMTGLIAPRDAALRGEALQWQLFGFSTVAALVTLTLLPAARRGPRYTANNGSPWPWPLYPWVLFGMLGAAVPVRAVVLCWSLDPLMDDERDKTIFGPYFLMPFAVAVGALLLEMGTRSRHRGVLKVALALPAIVAGWTLFAYHDDPINLGFRRLFTARFGSDPLRLTLLAAAVFYAYAIVRRAPLATGAICTALVALAFVGPKTVDVHTLRSPQPLPILAVAVLQLWLGLGRQDAWRCLLGTMALSVGLALTVPQPDGLTALHVVVAYHVLAAGLLALGVYFGPARGEAFRASGATLLLVACLAATFGQIDLEPTVPPKLVAAYPLAIAAFLAGYGIWLDPFPLVVAGVVSVTWLCGAGWHTYVALRQIVRGLDQITLSLLLFAAAVLVSLAKAGRLPQRFGGLTALLRPPIAADAGVSPTAVTNSGGNEPPLEG